HQRDTTIYSYVGFRSSTQSFMYMRSIYHASFMYLNKPDGMFYVNSTITYSLHSIEVIPDIFLDNNEIP
ncbi:MAG: hypothetical protein AAB116_12160, partial [Candidatus Poribacteria bacterium]